ncbi:hypothetical protein HMPREF9555_00607, partial [Selenomonas artemidis F0399]
MLNIARGRISLFFKGKLQLKGKTADDKTKKPVISHELSLRQLPT